MAVGIHGLVDVGIAYKAAARLLYLMLGLALCYRCYQKQNELKVLELLKRKEVDGVMLCSLENEWEDIKKYVKYGPVVMANEFHAEADSVTAWIMTHLYTKE